MRFRFTYNTEVIKGKEIADYIEKHDSAYKIINDRIESFKAAPKMIGQENSLRKTLFLCGFFLIFNMFLPFTGKWYDELITIPKPLKIFSFAVLLNMALSAYVF